MIIWKILFPTVFESYDDSRNSGHFLGDVSIELIGSILTYQLNKKANSRYHSFYSLGGKLMNM